MFLSSFFGIIDSKNRIAIPSSYRGTIKETKEKVYLFKSLKYPCLEIHLASRSIHLLKVLMKKIFFQKKMIILKPQFCLILRKLTSTMMEDLHLGKHTNYFQK